MGVSGPLSFWTKLSYGIGQAGEGFQTAAMASLLLFYYNQVLGVPPGWVSAALGAAVIVDAFTDPLAGSISDYWHSKLGRRHPFMYAAALPLAICFVLLFWPPVTGTLALTIWLVVFTNLARTVMTLYHVPHLALGAEMSSDFNERTSIVAYRQFFSTMGLVSVGVVGFSVFFASTPEFKNGQLNPAAYPPFAITFALLIFTTILWSAWGTRSVIPHLPKPPPREAMSLLQVLARLLNDTFLALQNRSFSWMFTGVLIVYVMVGVDASLGLYMSTYFWELSPGQIAIMVPAYAVGAVVGTMAAPWVVRQFGKRPALVWGTACWSALQIIPVVLRLMDWFPENGSALLLPTLVVIRIVQGAGTIQATIAFGSMMADIADEHDLRVGKRQEGVFFAASSFSLKCAAGVGTILSGIGLAVINWPDGKSIRTAADIPHDTLINLALMYGPIVAAFGVVAVWCYSHYKLTRERHEEILEELRQRNAAASAPPN